MPSPTPRTLWSTTQPDVLTGLLQSGLISTPQQVVDLQQQLVALSVGGGKSVTLPPVYVNVTSSFVQDQH
jgi:hypothetical protein